MTHILEETEKTVVVGKSIVDISLTSEKVARLGTSIPESDETVEKPTCSRGGTLSRKGHEGPLGSTRVLANDIAAYGTFLV